jgi:hypothetical protein
MVKKMGLAKILLAYLLVATLDSNFGPTTVRSDNYDSNDMPIQLVRPAANHRDLELVESNLMMLRKLRDPVAMVAVVGKFHSGKSFLMNQLMGKSAGFGIGPSVQPKTMGIWMWGQPLVVESSRAGRRINIVFLDTEGFAANNVTENYDAKVFAVSTLLSSHLLYNSVKIIDQSDIDYLELLARRTQLFALRSQLSKSKWTSDFNQDLLTFPPLTWVVQDFVQETHQFETPTEWLHRLMGGHSRESDNYTISLLDIFEQVDCHTLFIPAFDKELLTDLSHAKDEDLSSDYRRERDQLLRKLKNNVVPKEKNEQYVTGADLAQLLRVLVTAANDGSLADVPSRWDTFVDRLQSTASDDCTTFYNKELDAFLVEKNKNQPVSTRSFDVQHQQIKAKAFELLEQLLHGLDDALITARRDLSTGIENIYLTRRELNEKKIAVKSNQIKSKLELVADEQLRKIALPVKSADLKKHADSICSQLIRSFQDELVNLVDAETLKSLLESFEKSLSLISVNVESSNKLMIETAIAKQKDAILKNFDEGVGYGQTKEARKPSILEKILSQLVKNSEEDFKVKTLEYKDEACYEASLALFQKELQLRKDTWVKKNQELAEENIKAQVKRYSNRFAERISNKAIPLPMDETNLNARLTNAGSELVTEFETMFSDFKDCCGYESQLNELQESILKIGREKQQENIKAYRNIVNDVFKKAKDLIKVSEEKYGNQYSFRKFVADVAGSLLAEGKASNWDKKLKEKVIDDFIKEDPDINRLMEAKKGIFATIIGFLEYLLSFIGL